MKYSSQLLLQYVDIPVSVDQLANDLTLKSCEVEEVIERKIPKEVVIGKVLDVRKHPNADTLFVTKVDCGVKGIFQICTGGENVSKNSFVPVALPGCYLPVLDVTIGERKMRGEESNGMICSKRELGFNEDEEYHWIWTLQLSKNPQDYEGLLEEWKVLQGEFSFLTDEDCGKSLKEVFPWMESFVLDVDNKTLTHRPDLFGHYGLAIEIGAIYRNKSKVESQKSKVTTLDYEKGEKTRDGGISINIDTHLCSFYGAISGTVKPLDETQIREKSFKGRVILRDLGLQPRQDWVNFGNLYMYMTGQPVHIFDADKISGTISVRQAKAGEKFLDLTGKEHSLASEDIVIADEKGVLALAGVIGGLESAYSDTTTRILIECAHFDAVQVRKTGMRLGIRTDAQQRFEKNIHPLWTKYCFETMRQERELDSVLDNIVTSNKYQVINTKTVISFDLSRCSKLIYGDETSLDGKDFREVLTGLGFEFVGDTTVIVPIWRGISDISIEDDLVEEYIRIRGYETISSRSLGSSLETIELSFEVKQQRFLEQFFLRHGVSQVETYPWASEQQIIDGGYELKDCYLIKNPIDTNMPYLRPSMLWSMLAAVVKNTQNFSTMKLFDSGKIWKSDKEYKALGVIIVGTDTSWNHHPFVELKSLLNALSPQIQVVRKEKQSSLYHPLQQADLMLDGKNIGIIASIHPRVLESQGIKETSIVAYAEIILDTFDCFSSSFVSYETNEQLLVRKEAGFLFDITMSYDELMQKVASVSGVSQVKIVDLYVGDRIPAGKKNVTVSIKIDATNKNGDYANEVLWNVVEVVKKIGGEVRS